MLRSPNRLDKLGQMNKSIYMDHHATTPVDADVLQAMLPYFSEHFGNPMSGSHSYGWKAQSAIERARKQVAEIIHADPNEIIFTSGATESVHHAIFGTITERGAASHIITTPTEHKCVLEACKRAERLGHQVTWLKVNQFGELDIKELENSIRENTALITLMHANNEVGTFHPINEVGVIAKKHNVLFHVDAAQTCGRHAINVREQNIDLLSISAHKFYGPKGVGALFVRQTQPRVHIQPFMPGGGQERGHRGGTVNVPAVVGLGAAAEKAKTLMAEEAPRIQKLRDTMIKELTATPGIQLNGHPTNRLCNNVNITIDGVTGDQILLALHNVAFSTGSACSSASGEVSHVLKAMGTLHANVATTLRFGLGRNTTEAEVDSVCKRLIAAVQKARNQI
jgi:cysteine desulfurase